jgi:hypothetical protein
MKFILIYQPISRTQKGNFFIKVETLAGFIGEKNILWSRFNSGDSAPGVGIIVQMCPLSD